MGKPRMELGQVWIHICACLDYVALDNLAKTPLWSIIREFANSQHLFYLRTRRVFSMSLAFEPGDWKEAYSCAISMIEQQYVASGLPLLLSASTDCSFDWNIVLRDAIKSGRHEVVRVLLAETEGRVHPEVMELEVITAAYQSNHAKVLQLLYSDERMQSNPIITLWGAVNRALEKPINGDNILQSLLANDEISYLLRACLK